jgi:SAM-dependent methyltransferase
MARSQRERVRRAGQRRRPGGGGRSVEASAAALGSLRPMSGTDETWYAERLSRLSTARWKQVLHVQAPFRWNVRRLARGRVLDVGCGIGRNLGHLDDAVGVDHNPDSIATARGLGYRAWTTAEWPTCSDHELGAFDTLLVTHVFEHLADDEAEALLREYLPFLRPQARLVLICPQEWAYARDSTHVRFVTDGDLADLARRVGFRVVHQGSFPVPRFVGRVTPHAEFVVAADRSLVP